MKRRGIFGRSTGLLIAANALVGLFVVLQVLLPAAPSAAATDEAGADALQLPEFDAGSLQLPAMSAMSEMLERPLFYSDRQLPKPPENTAPPPPPRPLMLKLHGVALAGASRVAVLRNTSNHILLQLAEGDTHDGWTLEEVTSTSARFRRDAQVTELLLDPESGGRDR